MPSKAHQEIPGFRTALPSDTKIARTAANTTSKRVARMDRRHAIEGRSYAFMHQASRGANTQDCQDDWQKCSTRILKKDEFLSQPNKKLGEELAEYLVSQVKQIGDSPPHLSNQRRLGTQLLMRFALPSAVIRLFCALLQQSIRHHSPPLRCFSRLRTQLLHRLRRLRLSRSRP